MLLEVKNLSAGYGMVEALKNISLSVEKGEIVALIGPNGAGKSTALKSICGLMKEYDGEITSGEVFYKKNIINGFPPYKLVRMGLSLVPEGRHVFPTMTVKENLEMGGFIRKNDLNRAMEKVFDLFPKLKERQKQSAGTLSSGEQQMLAIGRALMLEPELLMLDEPSLGLSPNFVDEVFEKLKDINQEGTTILLVEQNARMALEYSNRAYVFKIGEIAFEGKSKELIGKSEVKKTFLGEFEEENIFRYREINEEESLTKEEIKKLANEIVLKSIPLPILEDNMEIPPLIQALEGNLINLNKSKQLLLPNFHEHINTVAIFSDYGGEAPTSCFLTYSFLFVGYDALYHIFESIKKIRQDNGLASPFVEMAFKKLNYGPAQRALDEWLRIGDYIPGFLFTLIIPKKIISVFGKNEKKTIAEIATILENLGFGKWKATIAEKMMRILHPLAYWSTLLAKRGHNIFWMTDDDAIVPNIEKTSQMAKVFGSILNIYGKDKFNKIGYSTPFKENGEGKIFCDLLSFPDLVAGSIENYLTVSDKDKEPLIKETTNKILIWLAHQGFGLKKLTMSVKIEEEEGRLLTSIVKIESKVKPKNVEYLSIDL